MTQTSEKTYMWIIKVYLEPTFKCNLHCKFCYVGEMQEQHTKQHVFEEQDIEQLKKNIDTVFLEEGNPTYDIDILWWEPNLNKNLNFIISYISRQYHTRRFTITSNATLYTQQKIQELQASWITEFRVSLHWLEQTHNSLVWSDVFSRVLESIRYLKDAKIAYTLIYVINQKNLEDILPLLDLLAGKDILPGGIFFEFVEFSGYALQHIQDLNIIYTKEVTQKLNSVFTEIWKIYPSVGMAFTNIPKCVLDTQFHKEIDDSIWDKERYEMYIPNVVRKSFFGFTSLEERALVKSNLKKGYKINFQSKIDPVYIPEACNTCEFNKWCYLLRKETILFEYLWEEFLKRKHYFEINKKISPWK